MGGNPKNEVFILNDPEHIILCYQKNGIMTALWQSLIEMRALLKNLIYKKN